jgi:hypothetical protein
MRSHVSTVSIGTLCLLLYAATAQGQDPAQTPASGPSLAAQVVDPTAPLKSLLLQNRYSPSTWGVDDEWNHVDVQISFPHQAFDMSHIFRITVPYITSQPSGERGLFDVALVDVALYPRKWGMLGVGGVGSLGTHKGPGIDTLAIGPAIVAVLKKDKWTYGVFNQNLFSFGDIATTQIQPILAYTYSDKVSFAIGDAQFTIDWNKGRVVSLPLSGQVNYIASVQQQPIRLFLNLQYNIINEPMARKWTVTTGLAFIVK